MRGKTTYLNLGCGSRYHPDWINIDIASRGPEVIRHDISRGIPLSDESCDVVYHTAVLEHLRCVDAAAFLKECCRVLKLGGIVRVGVPDLEKICRLYLARLEAVLEGDETAVHDYVWIMMELYDQHVREKCGGGMADYLRRDPLPNETFVYDRIGEEGRELVKALRQAPIPGERTSPGFLRGLRGGIRSLPGTVKRRIPQWLLGESDKRALEIGRFRTTGEVHQWMYDRFSLARLLRQTGFDDPRSQEAGTSRIPDWTRFHLDTRPDGRVIKPDLLFMEAIKAEAPIEERTS